MEKRTRVAPAAPGSLASSHAQSALSLAASHKPAAARTADPLEAAHHADGGLIARARRALEGRGVLAPDPEAASKQGARSELARSLLELHGPYVPPSLERAQRHRAFVCDHHAMFSLARTRTSDLSEFGNGHKLYFWFLRCAALAFAALSVVQGLPLMYAYARDGTFFSSGGLRRATLGNYGPVYAETAALADGAVRRCPSLRWRGDRVPSPGHFHHAVALTCVAESCRTGV